MRQATHNILYTTANSWAYDEEHLQTGMVGWKKAAIAIDVVLAAALAGLAVLAIRKYKK
jgi:beta-glucosidase